MCITMLQTSKVKLNNLHKVTSLCRTRIYVNIFMTLMPVSTTIWLCTQDSQLPEASCEEQGRERKWSSDQWIPTVMLRNMQEITWFFLRHKVNPLNKDFFFLIRPSMTLFGMYFWAEVNKILFLHLIYSFSLVVKILKASFKWKWNKLISTTTVRKKSE